MHIRGMTSQQLVLNSQLVLNHTSETYRPSLERWKLHKVAQQWALKLTR